MAPRLFETISGIKAQSEKALLPGYRSYQLQHRSYPGIVQYAGAKVQGCLYRGLGRRQFKRLDEYEGVMYRRKLVTVRCEDGRSVKAWCYVIRDVHAGKLAQQEWSLDDFLQHHLDQTLAGLRFSNEYGAMQADHLIK